jgi:hypothetical protein
LLDGTLALSYDHTTVGKIRIDTVNVQITTEFGQGVMLPGPPSTIALFGLGLAGFGWSRRKQHS